MINTQLKILFSILLTFCGCFINAQETAIGLNLKEFGAKGDSKTDDYASFKKAIDSCAKTGKTLYIPSGNYRISQTLELRDGVTLTGENTGNTPLQTPNSGTILNYTGSENAILITGHNVTLSNLNIVDKSSDKAQGGILVYASNRLLENFTLKQTHVFGFTNGYALKFEATKRGGICYATIYDLSIRNAKIGIEFFADSSSFVNSNAFYHGVISGGGFDVAIWAKGGNNNQFYGMCIEPYSSKNGHIVVDKGEIQGENIRVEGNKQDPIIPLIKFAKNTRNSHINGLFSGGIIADLGNNKIELKDAKTTAFSKEPLNEFENPYFSFSSNDKSITGWNFKASNTFQFKIIKSELIDGFNVLEIVLPPGNSLGLSPSKFNSLNTRFNTELTFGFHVQTKEKHAIYTTVQAANGMATSYFHTGNGEWEFVGMNAIIDTVKYPNPTLHLENKCKDTSIFKITTPVCNFGNQPLQLSFSTLEAKGGMINGMIKQTLNTLIINEKGILAIPSTSNYFEISNLGEIKDIIGAQSEISKGTVITLLCNQAGIQLKLSDKFELKEGFTSNKFGSITLISLGSGVWREVNRN